MFCLKWFNTPSIGQTEKLTVTEQPEGPIMNMPDLWPPLLSPEGRRLEWDRNLIRGPGDCQQDLVMRKIMDNVDFITICSSRPLKDFDEAEDHLHEINKKYTLQPTADKCHDRFDCILKSRESLLPIQSLRTEVLHPSCFLNTVRLVDMKQLKEIVIRKSCEQSAKKDEKDIVFNEIVELDVFKYIQVLNIRDFKVTVPLETFLHIPDLRVSVSTITIEDVLLIKKNMFNSPSAKSRFVHFDHVENEEALRNTVGHANPRYNVVSWYYKLPESDQALQISRDLYFTRFSFTWIKTSLIPKDAVVY